MAENLPFDEDINVGLSRYSDDYKMSLNDPDNFWEEKSKIIDWLKPFDKVLDDSKKPFYKWFINGKTNLSYNCLDRHIKDGKRNKMAIIWISEKGKEKSITYFGLYRRVNAFARGLLNMGIKKGDRVTIYLPMILEAPIAMLACARIGAVFNVVFSGFGAEALAQRINDSNSKTVITADGGYRRGKVIELKNIVDKAIDLSNGIDNVIVVKNVNNKINMDQERDYYYSDIIDNGYTMPEEMDSNDPLFMLYTSGTTGNPKGILHSTGGYMVWVANTLRWTFNPDNMDIYWCNADIGWITGHSYAIFGPLMLGLTSIMYEGPVDYPYADIVWGIIEKFGVSILYTSPTAIRLLMKYGEKYPEGHDLSSLRLLGTAGEPINPPAWHWYYEVIGKSRCPVIDTYWQTETSGPMISPLSYYGIYKLKPGSATFPLPGIDMEILDGSGNAVKNNEKGYIVVKKPWPGLMLTVNNDDKRYVETYFSKFKNKYLMGDYAIKDDDGYYWLLGRSDEVLNVSGHRIGTVEIEDGLVSMNEINESAVFGKPDKIRGDAIIAFVTLKNGYSKSPELINSIKMKMRNELGSLMVPEEFYIVNSLPKTRSGKIMRRVIRDIYLNNELKDISTLENPDSLNEIKNSKIVE